MANQRKRSKLILSHGGYRELRSYRMTEIVYEGTAVFCAQLISQRSRSDGPGGV